MNTRTPEPARPPEPSRHPRGASPYQNRPAPPPADGRASLSPDPASPAAAGPRPASPPCRSSLRRRLRPPENAATLLRGARTVALALAALALGVPEMVQAQIVTLVSNSGQADAGTRQPGANTFAQSFDTGSNSYGYNLSSIALDFAAAPTGTGTLTVTVREDSSGSPSETVLYTLNNPTHSAGLNEFLAQGNRHLNARTTYWVVASYSTNSGGGPTWSRTGISNGVDAGAAAGWVIDAEYKQKLRLLPGATWSVGALNQTLQIAVKGTVKTTANNAPTAADNTVTLAQDGEYTFTAADFVFDDTDSTDMLASVRIETVPAAGRLALNGTAAIAGQVVTRAQIDDGDLTFTPAAGASGDSYTTFTFKVNDGTVDSDDAYTMTINVTPDATCAATSFGDRRNFWTGTVTVTPVNIGPTTGHGFSTTYGPGSSLLPDRRFSIGSNAYQIYEISARSTGALRFSTASGSPLSAAHRAALRLHVCDTGYDFSAASITGGGNYNWSGSLDWSSVTTRTVYLSLPANNAATGAPAITGTATVDEMLTATAGDIADTDGLPSSFTYQWFRVDADDTSNEEEISGETVATYTLTDDDIGKRIKVKVSFTDNLNGKETRTSAATAVVATTPPEVVSVEVNSQGETLTILFDKALDEDAARAVPDSAYVVTVDGQDVTITGTSVFSGDTVILSVPGAAIRQGQTVTVSYTDPTAGDDTVALQDVTGNDVAGFTTGRSGVPAVTNGSTVPTTDTTPPEVKRVVVNEVNLVVSIIFDEALDEDAANVPPVSAFSVTADGQDVEITHVRISFEDTVILEFPDAAIRQGQTVVVSYTDPTAGNDIVALQDRVGNDVASFSVTVNTPATGAPTITGTAQVGQTLTAVTTGILDADGLTSPTYTYEWIRVNGTEARIPLAMSSTYLLVAADLGKTIKVWVTFDDDAGNTETRTSAATAVVAAAADATCAAPSFGDRRNFWTGTVTVRPLIGFEGTPVERIIGHGHQVGGTLLPNNRFSLGSVVDFKILEIYATTDGDLKFNLNKSLTGRHKAALQLHVCDVGYDFSAGTTSASNQYQWSGSLDWSGYRTRTVYLSLPANNEATGAAAIFGTATVGETLRAAAVNIADTDGLPGPSTYTYQWFRVDADGTSNEEEISGVTVFTYTLTDDDIGKRIKVKLSFTDQLNGKETRTSAATAVVVTANTTPVFSQANALVSNVNVVGKFRQNLAQVGALDVAQGFRTGGNTGGYTLESIEIDFARVWPSRSDASNLRVTLWSATSGQRPAKVLATLTNPSDLSVNSGANVKRFTAPPFTNLNANTMYFVRLSFSGSSRLILDVLDSTDEDAGRALGWSINNFVLQRGSGSTADWSHPKDGIVRIRVNGTAGATPNPSPSCDTPAFTGRHRIWTGELTVEAISIMGSRIFGYGFVDQLVGNLDPTGFSIGANAYTVENVNVILGPSGEASHDGDLEFRQDNDLRAEEVAALRLHVCDTYYDFSAANYNSTTKNYRWIDDLDWSSISSRTLYLSLPEGYLLPAAPAGAPSALSAQSVSGKPGYLRLAWTPAPASGSGLQPAHTTDYEARYRKTGAPDWSPTTWSFRDYGTPGFTGPPTTPAAPKSGDDAPLIHGLEANTQYDVQVRATNPYGESGWSNRVSATTVQATTANDDGTVDADTELGPAAAPSQPTVRRVENEPGLMVRWNAPRTVSAGHILTGYDVEIEKERERNRRITTLRKSYLYKLAGGSVTNLLIPGLEPNTAYTVRVRAVLIATVVSESDQYSPWSPDTAGTTAAGRAHNIQLSLVFPDGTRSTTVAPGAEVTYRVKATGIHDWAAVRARGGIGKANIRIWEPERHKFHFFRYSYYESTKGILEHNFINQTSSSGYLEGAFTVPDEAGAGASGTIEIQLVRPESCSGSACTVGSVNASTNRLCIAVDRSGTVAHPCSSGQTQAVAPTVEGTPGLSASGSDGSWTPGETVEAIVTFSEAVTVVTSSGTPAITLTLGGTLEQSARYTRGSGSKALVFVYTLIESDGSHTAMGVKPDSLALNGGSITSEASGADADLGHNGAIIMGERDGGRGPRGTRGVPERSGPTASFSDLPATHDGKKPFTVTLSFSAKPRGLSYKTVRDSLLEVTGGTVTKALRVNDASDREWKVTVAPSQAYGITLTLPPRACSETAAVCVDGRPLARAASARIPGKALTASLSGPAEHDGSESFTVRLTFNTEPDVSYKTVRDTMFTEKGGAITGARRVKPPHDREFDIVVKPGGNAAVSFSLASPLPACGETGAVCTAGGRKLEGTASVTIPGPAALSVADARAEEATGATVDFTVTLSRAASRPVTVDYATSDGTATAGADYTATSGTLTFAAGASSQTVSVPVLDDIHDDDGETFTLTFFNPSGAWIADGQATGTIENSDPLQRAWLARFGRTTATHVTDAIGERLRATPGQASHLTVGGYRLPWGQTAAAAGEEAEPEADDPLAALVTGLATGLGLNLPGAGGPDTDPRLGRSQTLRLQLPRLRDVLLGSSFRLTLGRADAGTRPRLTAWGRVAATQFNGQDGALTLDGDVLTGTVGVDGEWDRWLAGVAVSHSRGDGSYTMPGLEDRGRGELDNTLTSLHPYLRYAVTDRLDVWGVLGYGWGELALEQETATNYDTDTTLVMGAVGGRGLLLAAAETGGFQLATRTDAMFTRTTSEAVVGLASADAEAHRLRVVLEGSRALTWADGRSLTPSVEVGLRHDWGDAETGFGLELGGRVQYADPSLGLTLDAAVRGLLAHEDHDYDEWGASGSLRLAPGAAGQGLSLTLAPTWGAAASGMDGLWTRQTTAGLAPGRTRAPAGRLNAEVGYGVPAPFGTGLLTPYAGTVFTDGAARTYRLGTRWTAVSGLSLTLEGRRQESPGQQPVNQGLHLQIGWGF